MNPKARPRSGLQLVCGIVSLLGAAAVFVLGYLYFSGGMSGRAGRCFLVAALALFTAYNCLRAPKAGPDPLAESGPVAPPPPLLATVLLVIIGATFFSLALLGLVYGKNPRLFLIVMAVSGLCIVLLLHNYWKLRKEYQKSRPARNLKNDLTSTDVETKI